MKTDAEIFASRGDPGRGASRTDRSSRWSTSLRFQAWPANPWPCPTSITATGSASAAWRLFRPKSGIVLPGGVGYDINCGVRLLATSIPVAEFEADRRKPGLRHSQRIPTGLTPREQLQPEQEEFPADRRQRLPRRSSAISRVEAEDLAFIESGGRLAFDRPEVICPRAFERGPLPAGFAGFGQPLHRDPGGRGRLRSGSGPPASALRVGTATVMIHTGSRGIRPPDRHRLYRNPVPQANLARI